MDEHDRSLREAEAREAALRGVLDVISRSRNDEKPVFDAILDSVSRLCAAPLVFLSIVLASCLYARSKKRALTAIKERLALSQGPTPAPLFWIEGEDRDQGSGIRGQG